MLSSLFKVRMHHRAALLIGAAIFTAGCSDNPAAPIPSVAGRVIVAATGEPLAGAKVSIGDASTVTDADGHFKLTDLVAGSAKIRGTATGFDPFEADVSVQPTTVTLDIPLKRIELFTIDKFSLYVPATVSKVRGILVALGGPDTRGFAAGTPFGAPLPQVEASLQTFGQQLRAMAASRGLAIVGTSRAAMANEAASDQAIVDAIQQAGVLSGRADLMTSPYMVYGLSTGGAEASGFVARNASRTAGLFLKVPLAVETFTTGPVLSVPTYVVLAELDAFVNNSVLRASYAANRGAGAPWALALELGVSHFSLSPAQRDLTANWMNTILGMRLGVAPQDPLRTVIESSGWIGDPASTDVMALSAYTGNPRTVSWFPSQTTAEEWRAFVRTGKP